MMVLIFITILVATILTNGAHAHAPMEPPTVNGVSNELIVDDAFPTKDILSVLNEYLDKVIAKLEDMEHWIKDGSDDTMVMPVSLFLYIGLILNF